MNSTPRGSIIVPTLNAGQYLIETLPFLLLLIERGYEVVIIDSGSEDSTLDLLLDHGIKSIIIPKAEFNHGRTRNTAAQIATSDNLIFMTQDAIPLTHHFADKMITSFEEKNTAAVFARQVPRRSATLIERFSRYFNYPESSQIRTQSDIKRLGAKAFFFSNVCSAVRADVFWKVGGFPEDVIMNEDMTLAAKLLRAGYAIKYVAEAEVIHSHDYTIGEQFRRNFDVGAFFADAGPELDGARVGGEGIRFVREQVRYVLRHGRADLIARVFAESAAKFTAFQLGKHHRWLPLSLKKRLSMHSYHWDQSRNRQQHKEQL